MDIDEIELTRANVAWLLGMSDSWVRDRMQAGDLPRPGATADEYVQAFVAFRLKKYEGEAAEGGAPLKLDAERARLAKAQADEKELDLAERRGELASRPDLTGAVIGLIKVSVARLMQVPAAVAQGNSALRVKLESAITDALRDLSITKVEVAMGGGVDDEDADEEAGADEED
jgi:phage terminase Nu1 subunit (DNA packaging protein)